MIKYAYEIRCDGVNDYYVNRILIVTLWGWRVYSERSDFINENKKWCHDSCNYHYTFDSIDAAKAGIEVANYKERLDEEMEERNRKLRGRVTILASSLKEEE